PKAFDILRVNCADHVLLMGVPNDLMRIFSGEALVADPFIRNQQRYLVRYGLAHKALQGRAIDAIDDASDDFPATADRANNGLLPGPEAATTGAATHPNVPVLSFAADKGFVNLHLAEQLALGAVAHRHTNAMAHVPRGFVGAGADHPVDLMSAHSLLGVVH